MKSAADLTLEHGTFPGKAAGVVMCYHGCVESKKHTVEPYRVVIHRHDWVDGRFVETHYTGVCTHCGLMHHATGARWGL